MNSAGRPGMLRPNCRLHKGEKTVTIGVMKSLHRKSAGMQKKRDKTHTLLNQAKIR